MYIEDTTEFFVISNSKVLSFYRTLFDAIQGETGEGLAGVLAIGIIAKTENVGRWRETQKVAHVLQRGEITDQEIEKFLEGRVGIEDEDEEE